MKNKLFILFLLVIIGISSPIVFADDMDGTLNDSDYSNELDIIEIENEKYLRSEVENINKNINDSYVIEINGNGNPNNNKIPSLVYDDPVTKNPNYENSKVQRYFTILTPDVQKGSYFQVVLKSRTTGSTDGIPIPNELVTFTLSGTQTTITTTTDANGIAKIKMTQNPGTYNIQFMANGCNNLIDVEVFEGNCHFKYQLNKLYQTEAFKVILLDANNNPLANKQISITVNGVSYYRTTDANGLSALNINFNTGNYVISYAFAGDNSYSQCSGSTLLQVIRKDVVLTPLTSSVVIHSQQYLVKLTDTSYKPIVNECVVITVNGVLYNRTTDSNGVAKLNINLNPGYFYSVTATYNPQSPTPYNSKTITTSLGVYEAYQESSINFTGTYFTRNSYLTVTLKTPYGSIISGRMVNLWINGNMYSYVTNNQGQVSFQLNLPTGIYGVTAMYGSIGHYSSYVYRLISLLSG